MAGSVHMTGFLQSLLEVTCDNLTAAVPRLLLGDIYGIALFLCRSHNDEVAAVTYKQHSVHLFSLCILTLPVSFCKLTLIFPYTR